MAKWKWFDKNAWSQWVPGWNIVSWIQGLKNGEYRTPLGTFEYNKPDENGQISTVNDSITDAFNNHNVSDVPDENGLTQVDINPSDPTSSASNVINYDPNKSAAENMLGYAQANNSASAYNTYLQNQWNQEMSNTAISRAIADAEANGISKYQLFQSGNMAASTPSSGSSMYQSYENAMNRRESWNEKEIAAVTAIIMASINAAAKMIK